MYKFYLEYNNQRVEIIEPVGFDGLELILERSESSHGISAEYSDVQLKFFDPEAISVLSDAYHTDIDSIVTFTQEENGIEEYKGVVDLSEYQEIFEENVCFISVKVGDIGDQTIFNSRIEQKVNIDSTSSFNGSQLQIYPMLKQTIEMPSKEIIKTSNSIVTEEMNAPASGDTYGFDSDLYKLAMGNQNLLEIGNMDSLPIHKYLGEWNSSAVDLTNREFSDEESIFVFNEQVGLTTGTTFNLSVNINSTFYLKDSVNVSATIYILHIGVDKKVLSLLKKETYLIRNITPQDVNLLLEDSIKMEYGEKIAIILEIWTSFGGYKFDYKLNPGNKISVSALSNTPPTTAVVSMIHEALSRVTESITDGNISVKSDYYGRVDSDINNTSEDGEGSYRAITTGLRIRNAKDTEGNNTPFAVSFKNIYAGISPIDNCGVGFSFENGKKYLRVEHWKWFYKDDIILEIKNSNNVVRKFNQDVAYSRFKIGYKKYETESINGLDAFMTEREYRTILLIGDKLLEKISEFISDSYAIEQTRRLSQDTKDWRYDNDIFIMCLKNESGYEIDLGVENAKGVLSQNTVYNGRISPARMAEKFIEQLVSFGFGRKEDIIFSSGKGNISAEFNVKTGSGYPDSNNKVYSENQNFSGHNILLLPETIEVNDYPLKKEYYKKIKNNPYGIVLVGNIPCFLSEMKYARKKNTASFVLIPKKV
jgi:hypothetical protein